MTVSVWWLLLALGAGTLIGLCLSTMLAIRGDAERRVRHVVSSSSPAPEFDDLLGPSTVM